MPDVNIPQGLAVVLSSYAKRFLEGKYDQLSDHQLFNKLKAQSPGVKYGIEATLYALTSLLDQYMGDETFIKKAFKEVGLDFASEFSKRMINGDQFSKAIAEKDRSGWEAETHREFISILADLDEKDLEAFLDWMDATTPEERKIVMKNVSRLSPDELIKILKLKPSSRERLLKFSEKQVAKEGAWETAMEPLNRRLDAYIQKNKREK